MGSDLVLRDLGEPTDELTATCSDDEQQVHGLLSRRGILGAGAMAAFIVSCTPAGGGGGGGGLTTTTTPPVTTSTTIAPGSAAASGLPNDQVLHLIRRITFGPTPALVAHVRDIGTAAFIEEQLNYTALNDGAANALVPDQIASAAYLYYRSPLEAAILAAGYNDNVNAHLQNYTIVKAWFSQRQLFEVMVDFWSNHFNVDAANIFDVADVRLYKSMEDRLVIRPNALGTFEDLLLADARSPAMLLFLDNATSRADGDEIPNENYARELLELHTVGLNGGYNEDDIAATARVVSGWSMDPLSGGFVFRTAWHGMDGTEQVMGWSAGGTTGLAAGQSLLRYLANHPSTAQFLATKLVRRFVSDAPPASLVSSTAAQYLSSGTDIKATLRHILNSPEFAASIGAKTRRPFELMIAALRGIGATIPSALDTYNATAGVRDALWNTNQVLFKWPAPTGYTDSTGYWFNAASVLRRWNEIQGRIAGGINGVSVNHVGLLGTAPSTLGDLVDRAAHRIMGHGLETVERNALLTSLGAASQNDRYVQSTHGPLLGQLYAHICQSATFQFR